MISELKIAAITEYLTVMQQIQDHQGLVMGYLRRLNLSNDEVKIMLEWCKENKPEICYDVFYKDLPSNDIDSCNICVAMNWDGG